MAATERRGRFRIERAYNGPEVKADGYSGHGWHVFDDDEGSYVQTFPTRKEARQYVRDEIDSAVSSAT